MSNYILNKEERISGKNDIDYLFEKGDSFIAFPLRIVYTRIKSPDEPLVSILVSVTKKRFKRAVKRNRLKRLIKEAYRLNKRLLMENLSLEDSHLLIAFLYVDQELQDYKNIEKGMIKGLQKLKEKLS